MDLIRTTIQQANLFIAVIGPDWLTSTGPDGNRRIDEQTDAVRIEIETALQYDVPVIPLLVDGASMPRADQLPPSIQRLASFNALALRYNPYFEDDIKQLIASIRQQKLTAVRRARRDGRSSKWGLRPISGLWGIFTAVLMFVVALVSLLVNQPFSPRQSSPTTSTNSCAGALIDGDLNSVVVSASGDGWAVGDTQSGTLCSLIVRYQNGHWSPFPSPVFADLHGVARVSRDEAWAVGNRGVILHYAHGKWTKVPSPTLADLQCVLMLSADDGWATGVPGTILHYTKGKWVPVDVPATASSANIKALSFLSADDGWASGDPGTILHYNNGAWAAVDSHTRADLHGLAMVSPTEGWAVGNAPNFTPVFDHFWRGVWTPVPEAATDLPQAISMSSALDGWAAGFTGTVMRYTDGQWVDFATPVSGALVGITMVGADTGWAVGPSGTIVHFANGVWIAN